MAVASGEQLVIFELNEQKCAIPVMNTQEIIKMVDVTPIPRADTFVEGVINLRGRIVPVVSLHRRLGLEQPENTRDTRIIVVEHNETDVGMIVDRVQEVGWYSPEELERPESVMEENEHISGVIKKEDTLWLLLQLDRLLPKLKE